MQGSHSHLTSHMHDGHACGDKAPHRKKEKEEEIRKKGKEE